MHRPTVEGHAAGRRATAASVRRLTPFLCMMLAGPAVAAGDTDATAIIARIAVKAPATQSFIEVRRTRLLKRPVISAGQLEFLGRGHLAKEVKQPRRQRLEIDGAVARVSMSAGQTREFDLANAPDVRAVFTALGGVLGGDVSAIRSAFRMTARQGATDWLLELTPVGSDVAKRVTSISFHGRDALLACVVVTEPNGTVSTTVMTSGQPIPRPSAMDEWLAAQCGTTP